MIAGLRQRGIKYIAIVSGDHRQPTRKLAESLGLENYFYDILPGDKGKIVEQMRKEGRSVCYVGDGINDTIAMKMADVSISLRGAATIATDTAEVVFMDGDMARLCDLFDLAARLEGKLEKCLNLNLASAGTNLCGAFIINYGILTSLIVNFWFSALAMKDAIVPTKEHPLDRVSHKNHSSRVNVKDAPGDERGTDAIGGTENELSVSRAQS